MSTVHFLLLDEETPVGLASGRREFYTENALHEALSSYPEGDIVDLMVNVGPTLLSLHLDLSRHTHLWLGQLQFNNVTGKDFAVGQTFVDARHAEKRCMKQGPIDGTSFDRDPPDTEN